MSTPEKNAGGELEINRVPALVSGPNKVMPVPMMFSVPPLATVNAPLLLTAEPPISDMTPPLATVRKPFNVAAQLNRPPLATVKLP